MLGELLVIFGAIYGICMAIAAGAPVHVIGLIILGLGVPCLCACGKVFCE